MSFDPANAPQPLVIAFLIFAAFGYVETKVALRASQSILLLSFHEKVLTSDSCTTAIVPMHVFKILTVCGVIFSTMLSGCICPCSPSSFLCRRAR